MIVGGRRSRVQGVLRTIVLLVGAVVMLLPFYLLVRNALMHSVDLTAAEWHWLPPRWAFDNLAGLFTDPAVPFGRALANTILIAVIQTLGVLLFSGLAGYGLARIPYRWSNLVFGVITATLLVPAAVTFVPTFVLVSSLGWVSTLRGLIVPGLFQALATFLFRQYFSTFPVEIEEAAAIDGLDAWSTFWRIVVPNSLGFAGAIGTITFISTWNAFLWPLVIAQDQSVWTVQIALSTMLTAQRVDLGHLYMAGLVSILPLMLVFVLLQRLLVQGVERTGLGE